jgi:hypothetical protein
MLSFQQSAVFAFFFGLKITSKSGALITARFAFSQLTPLQAKLFKTLASGRGLNPFLGLSNYRKIRL